VRELRNVVERAVLLAPGEYIDTPDLRLNASDARPPRLEQMSLEDAERALVHAALRRFEGNVAAAPKRSAFPQRNVLAHGEARDPRRRSYRGVAA
jgi:DNA-binding NtrC family response regulator